MRFDRAIYDLCMWGVWYLLKLCGGCVMSCFDVDLNAKYVMWGLF